MTDTQQFVEIGGVHVPRLIYGTAWKEDETRSLAAMALQIGFRGIDTANQRRHYHEAGVGEAVTAAIENGLIARDELFLQTKFTSLSGQDQRLPYDAEAPVAQQVQQSFASSLEHLGVERIDSYVLHGPMYQTGLCDDDWAAWRAMEAIYDGGQARLLGVSNVGLEQLESLYRDARVKPRVVQNRCFAVRGWDRSVREFCRAHDMLYQGFSLLTANRQVLADPHVECIAERHDRSPSEIIFRFALAVGMIALTGTTDADHMRADLAVLGFELDAKEIKRIERVAVD